jgi:hypothetical protein
MGYEYENPAPSMLAVCKAVGNSVCEGRIDENPVRKCRELGSSLWANKLVSLVDATVLIILACAPKQW